MPRSSGVKERASAMTSNKTTSLHIPVSAFQIRTVMSFEADASFVESCENTSDKTMPL
jgi:hypothetical protein